MNNYYVKSLPISDVVDNLAEEFGASLDKHCNFYQVEIPKNIGSGTISGMQFESGFAMLNYDCQFLENTEIHFTYEQVHPIKFIHCYQGGAIHHFENDNEEHSISAFENIVVAGKRTGGHVLHFKKDETVKLCSVEIDRSKFFDKISCLLEGEQGPIVSAIRDRDASERFYRKGKYNLAISNVILKVISADEITLANVLLKEGDCYRMLSYQWLEFKSNNEMSIIQQHEYEIFRKMRDYIHENISQNINMEVLSNQFFLSKKKIQKLFKSATNNTVNKYLQDYRLEKSLEYLSDPNNNISEVVYSLGLKNRSYFTKIFKQRFQITPSEYMKNAKGA